MPASTTSLPELTAEQVQRILVQPLNAKSAFLSSAPRVFDVTAAGPVRIPRLVGMTSPSWVGENTLIPEVEADTDEVVLLDGIKSLKSITRYSNEMARSSVVALDAALQDRMVFEVAAKLDAAFIGGTGDPDGTGKRTTPLGIVNYAGTQQITDVGTPSLDDLHDAVGMMLGANADPSRARWLLTSRDFVNLRKIKAATGSNNYVLQPDPTQDNVYRLLGIPVTVTNRIPVSADDPATATINEAGKTSIVLADFSQIAVARDLAPSVKILTERYADFDQQAIRVVAHYDAAPLNPQAVVVLRGVTV